MSIELQIVDNSLSGIESFKVKQTFEALDQVKILKRRSFV